MIGISTVASLSLYVAVAIPAAEPGAGAIRIPMRFNHVPYVRKQGAAQNDLPMSGSDQRYGMYNVDVVVGGQTFSLMVDTGSADLALGAVGCHGCRVKDHPPYNPKGEGSHAAPLDCEWCSESATDDTTNHCKDRGDSKKQCTYIMGYADQSGFSAALYNDTFTFADGNGGGISSLAVTAQVGAMYEANFPNPKFTDGIIGFAGKAATRSGAHTPMDILVAGGKTRNVFSICLQPDGHGGHLYLGTDGPSGLTATGQPMPTMIQGMRVDDTVWTPLVFGEGFYGVTVEDVMIGGQSIEVDAEVYNNGTAILDSGTQDVEFPSTAFRAIKNHFFGLCKNHSTCLKGICDCQNHKPLTKPIFWSRCVHMTKAERDIFPVIEVKLAGGVTVQYPPSNYLKNGAAFCDEDKPESYTIALSEMGPDGSGSILGESFMQGYLVVHDREHMRVGLQPVSDTNCPGSEASGAVIV